MTNLYRFLLCLLGRHEWLTFGVGRSCRRCGKVELWNR